MHYPMVMKKGKSWYLSMIFILATLIGFGCEDEKDELQIQLDDLKFELVALDDYGNEGTFFTAGTDIALAIKVTNNSDKVFLWDTNDECNLFVYEEFYAIYVYENQDANGDVVNLGKPYDPIAGYVGLNFRPKEFHPGVTIFLEEPWSNNHAIPLSAGKYWNFKLNSSNFTSKSTPPVTIHTLITNPDPVYKGSLPSLMP